MNIHYRNILVAAALVAAVFGAGCVRRDVQVISPEPVVEAQTPRPESPVNTDAFLDIARFHASASVTSTAIQGRIIAGVVNHHVLASDVLARTIRSVCDANPAVRRIIILSPDHFMRGDDAMSVVTVPYSFEGNVLPVDTTSTQTLLRIGSPASRDLVEHEHGIGALIPFLSRYCQNVHIASVALRADISRERARAVGVSLASIVDDQTVVLVSSDMSHYLSEREALAHDVQTEAWLRSRDRVAMERATDANTDNGPAFVALFSFFEARNDKPAFQRVDHAISSAYGGDSSYTTSYLTGVWVTK
jgi:poly-gamma-glutamate synthesis protein (capsule biosynthesis protein)